MYIKITSEQTKELCETLRVSRSLVSLSLRFKRNSFLARKIREYAMNKLNGIIYKK